MLFFMVSSCARLLLAVRRRMSSKLALGSGILTMIRDYFGSEMNSGQKNEAG
jgi:hypothetical protein